jgi:hypothetical protein
MKTIKQKYIGMKREELVKALDSLMKAMIRTRIMVLEDPKAYAEIVKQKYERALLKTLLQMPDSK